MKYNTLVPIKQRLKEYMPEFDTIWVSRQFLRRLVKAEFRVAENESDSAPFSTHHRDAPTPFALLFANRYLSLKICKLADILCDRSCAIFVPSRRLENAELLQGRRRV